MTGEPDSFFGHLVKTRCLDFLLSIATEIAVPEIVREDEDDVGAFRCFSRRRNDNDDCKKQVDGWLK
jgi:hypothetical protein